MFNEKRQGEIQKMYNYMDSACLNKLVFIDREIHRLVSLIRNYLYLPEEHNLENTLFIDYILYPYILFFYDAKESNERTVSKAVDSLRGLMSEASNRITSDGYVGVGRLLETATNKMYEAVVEGDCYNQEIAIKKQLFIHNPNSIHSAEFQARFEEADVLAEYIGIGYENFISRSVKFLNPNGLSIFRVDFQLQEIEAEIRSEYMSEILLNVRNCRRKNGKQYIENYTYIKNLVKVLSDLEKEFIKCNCAEQRYKARLYFNILNSALKI